MGRALRLVGTQSVLPSAAAPVCRGSFQEAATCISWMNGVLRRALQPYMFASVCEDDPYRIALFHRVRGELPFTLVNFENYREPAELTLAQGEHLCGMFTRIGFQRRELQLWEVTDFENDAHCRHVILKQDTLKSVNLFAHGVTSATLHEHADLMRAELAATPAYTRPKFDIS